jgi:hypothetical protein
MQFNGVTDYVNLGNVYRNLTLPFTISAWVYLDPTTNFPAPIFSSADNGTIYNGFWLFVWQNSIVFEYGDGKGGNNPAFRRGTIAPVNNVTMLDRWIHVCGVMNGPFDIQLYVNGIEIGGNSSGESNFPIDSSVPGDSARIGYYFANGVNYWFHGSIDEIRLWNRGLTAAEVRAGMCKKLSVSDPGLIGYWNFNETSGNIIFDKSLNGYSGQLKGNPTRTFPVRPSVTKVFMPIRRRVEQRYH